MRAFNIQQPLVIETSQAYLSRKWIIAYIVLQSVVVVLQNVSLVLPRWFKYCWWYFGVASVKSFTDLSAFDGEYSIEDVHTDACGKKESFTESHCPDLCDNIENFKAAGGVMIAFGLLSSLFGIALILLHLIKHYRPEFQFKFILVLGIVQSALFSSGVLAFYFIAQLESLKTHTRGLSGSSKPADISLESGILLAMCVSGCTGGLVLLSYFKTGKAFKKTD